MIYSLVAYPAAPPACMSVTAVQSNLCPFLRNKISPSRISLKSVERLSRKSDIHN